MSDNDKVLPGALLIHQGAIGDFIIACRLIEFCDKNLEKHSWSYLGKVAYGKLASALGLIEDYRDFDNPGWHLLFSKTPIPDKLQTFLKSFDLIVNVATGADTNFAKRLDEISAGRVCHIDPKLPQNYKGHVFEYLVNQLAFGPIDTLPKTAINVKGKKTNSASNMILIHPGASGNAKRWPIKCFVELAEKLAQIGYEPAILLGEVEIEQFDQNEIDDLKSIGKTFIKLPLVELAELIVSAKAYIGNDNGISHLAGALGAKTIVIFMRDNWRNWQPLGPNVNIIPAEDIDFQDVLAKIKENLIIGTMAGEDSHEGTKARSK